MEQLSTADCPLSTAHSFHGKSIMKITATINGRAHNVRASAEGISLSTAINERNGISDTDMVLSCMSLKSAGRLLSGSFGMFEGLISRLSKYG